MAFHYKSAAERLLLGGSISDFAVQKQWDELTRAETQGFSGHVWRSPAFWFQIVTTVVISVLVFALIGDVARVL